MEFRHALTDPHEDAARDGRTDPIPVIYSDGDHHRLLAVDDDPMILDLTSIILTREGYEVQQADSTAKAIHFMQAREFDLVLTDLHMPEMNGIALLQWIKNYDPAIGVIIITGDRDASYAGSAVRYGADDYLLKPFNRDILLTAVEHFLINRKLARLDTEQPGRDRVLDVVKNAAHDIRDGLVGVAANLKVLQNRSAGEDMAQAAERLQTLQDKIRHLTGVTEEYFSMANTLCRQKKISLEELDLEQDIIEEVLPELELEIRSAGVMVQRAAPEAAQPVRVRANRVLLKSVYRVLLSNAIRHCDGERKIVYGIGRQGADYRLNVFNSGTPLPAEARKRLFQHTPASRPIPDSTRQGLGVGLMMAREIVTEHKGRLWYEPRPNGSDFIFTLPCP